MSKLLGQIGSKLGQNGLTMGFIHLLKHLKWSGITFAKTRFLPIFDPMSLLKWCTGAY